MSKIYDSLQIWHRGFQEADDVLTLAGVDPNDEAKLMLAQGAHDDQSCKYRICSPLKSRLMFNSTLVSMFGPVHGRRTKVGRQSI